MGRRCAGGERAPSPFGVQSPLVGAQAPREPHGQQNSVAAPRRGRGSLLGRVSHGRRGLRGAAVRRPVLDRSETVKAFSFGHKRFVRGSRRGRARKHGQSSRLAAGQKNAPHVVPRWGWFVGMLYVLDLQGVRRAARRRYHPDVHNAARPPPLDGGPARSRLTGPQEARSPPERESPPRRLLDGAGWRRREQLGSRYARRNRAVPRILHRIFILDRVKTPPAQGSCSTSCRSAASARRWMSASTSYSLSPL